jgi:hypothetical protein
VLVLCDEEIVEHISMIQESDTKLWIFEVMDSMKHDKFIIVLMRDGK